MLNEVTSSLMAMPGQDGVVMASPWVGRLQHHLERGIECDLVVIRLEGQPRRQSHL